MDPARWQEAFEAAMSRMAGRFARVEPRRRVRDLVLGPLSDLPRKNCWSIAELAGEASPDGMQHLLARARWDADRVRDDVRAYVLEHLGDQDAVLVVDETGDVNKGTHTVGVRRQYTGTAGRIENAQADAGTRRWTGSCTFRARGRATRTAAGPRVTRSTAATPSYGPRWKSARWATCSPSPARPKRPPAPGSSVRTALAARAPKRAWQKLSAGAGAKDHRFYDWAVIDLAEPQPGCHRLVIRRNRTTGELACYRCYSPAPLPLTTLVRVAGSRWWMEETFQAGKGPGRTGRAPGPTLHLMVPPGHPGHARSRLPRRRPRR
ncbi:IS701 family transposase [Actinomadura kijaniata]